MELRQNLHESKTRLEVMVIQHRPEDVTGRTDGKDVREWGIADLDDALVTKKKWF